MKTKNKNRQLRNKLFDVIIRDRLLIEQEQSLKVFKHIYIYY